MQSRTTKIKAVEIWLLAHLKRRKIDAKNAINRDVPDVEDNQPLPFLHTKAGEDEEDESTVMQNILSLPPTMRRSVANDESTITSNLTMDTRLVTYQWYTPCTVIYSTNK